MIFRRTTLRDFSNTAMAVFSALFAISLTSTTVRVLGRAAGGKLPTEAVLATVGFTSLNYLPVLLALTVFVAVLLVLSRCYRDSEMVVWFAAGQPLTAWMRPVLIFALPIVALIAGLSLFLTPWANRELESFRQQLSQREEMSRIAPGVFLESANADRVLFIESLSQQGETVENVFVSFRQHGRLGIIVARRGYTEEAENGDRFAVLVDGRRYEGTAGTPEYRVMDFHKYYIRIEAREAIAEQVTIKGVPTLDLIASPTRDHLAELLWRIGLPFVALILALMAIPLSFVNPRASTSVNLLFAVFVYMVYTNLLSIAQARVQQGQLTFGVGWWIVHALMFSVFAVMLYRRMSLTWIPGRLRPRGGA